MPMKAAFFDTKTFERQAFEQAEGFADIDWRFFDFRLSADTAVAAKGCEAVCAFVNDRLDAECLKALKDAGVGLVALRCAGFNNLDQDAARDLGLRVTRVPAYSPHGVAEYTVALLLTLNRKIHRAYHRVREHNFALHGLVGFDLHGKTVGIVGTGQIGRITAEIFRGFGTKLLVTDPYPNEPWAEQTGAKYVPLDELLQHSDIVSLHLPLTVETNRMINEEQIAKMKKGAYLINTGRGKLISTRALIQALKSEQLGGVALDVYEEEEGIFFEDLSGEVLKDDELARLLTFPNVLVTSHQAFLTREALTEIARVTTENVIRFGGGGAFLEQTELVAPAGSA
jgi:D-lactate dehydrogenase